MSPSRTVSEIISVKEWRDLEIGYSRSLKIVPFKSLYPFSYSHFIVTMALSCIIREIKRDIGQKSRFFVHPYIRRPHYRGPHRNIAVPFGVENYNSVASWRWTEFDDRLMFRRFDRIPACDRRTDGHFAARGTNGYSCRHESLRIDTQWL